MKTATANSIAPREMPTAAAGSGSLLWADPGALHLNRTDATAPHLTSRQREVLALLCEGMPNKLICQSLNIAPGTVKTHVSTILRELGVASRLQAVVATQRYGLAGQSAAGDEHPPVTGTPSGRAAAGRATLASDGMAPSRT
ncbi:MAG: response regulator transcription factor [Burkholderiales bacterium]|nr:response regulator transcription factor [Burkholderiales bacterium]